MVVSEVNLYCPVENGDLDIIRLSGYGRRVEDDKGRLVVSLYWPLWIIYVPEVRLDLRTLLLSIFHIETSTLPVHGQTGIANDSTTCHQVHHRIPRFGEVVEDMRDHLGRYPPRPACHRLSPANALKQRP